MKNKAYVGEGRANGLFTLILKGKMVFTLFPLIG
jgi:hypothetical protein